MDESQVNKPEQIKHFTLETFKKAFTDMIATMIIVILMGYGVAEI